METIREYLLRTELCKLSRDEFAVKYASSPPLLVSLRGQSNEETARVMTVVITPSERKSPGEVLDRFVYPVEKVGQRNVFASWVTLGRAPNNDLIVPNPSISKFHATFTKTAWGYMLCDRNSTNGTVFLEGESRDRLVQGKERLLEDRCTIEFGAENGEVMMYFVRPSSVYDFLSGFK